MKKIFALLAILACGACLLSSCGDGGEEAVLTTTETVTSQATSESSTAAEEPEPEPEPDHRLHIVEKGVSTYNIVLSSDSLTKPSGNGVAMNSLTGKVTKLDMTVPTPLYIWAGTLVTGISEKTACNLNIDGDGEISAGEFEILIGNTTREASQSVKKELSPNTYAIRVVDSKLVIVGYNDNVTLEALKYLTEHFDSIFVQDGELLVVNETFSFIGEVPETPASILRIGGTYTLKDADLLASIPVDGEYRVMQGGATDGQYLYYCMENQSLSAHESYIYKIDPETGRVVKRSASLQLDHSNDMTYNAKLRQLLVVHNAPNRKYVTFVDIDTLQKVKTIKLDWEIFCIAYNEERDEYCIGLSGGQSFSIVDSDFKFIRRYNIAGTGYTTQGMTCDGNYLYFAQSGANVVVVYDWDGYRIDVVPIEFTEKETENISIIGNDVYIGFYVGWSAGGKVYKTKFTER